MSSWHNTFVVSTDRNVALADWLQKVAIGVNVWPLADSFLQSYSVQSECSKVKDSGLNLLPVNSDSIARR